MIRVLPYGMLPLAPILVLALTTASVLLLVSLFRKSGREAGILALVGTLMAGAITIRFLQLGLFLRRVSGALVLDRFALLFSLLFLATAAVTILASISFVIGEGKDLGEYFVLILTSVLGMILMASSENLLVIFLGLEILSLSLYTLAGFTRDREKSVEAALKYFLLGAFSTAFILYGVALLYGATRSIDLQGIVRIFSVPLDAAIDSRAFVGMGLVLVGFAFKVGAVPFHFWIPDVYQGAPTPVAGFMAAGTKTAALAMILRVFLVGFQGPRVVASWVSILTLLAIATMTVGNVVALAQTNIKRMLAYSSVAHAGYLMVGVIVSSDRGSRQGALSAIAYYLAGYIFMNLGAFTVVSLLGRRAAEEEEGYSLYDYSGLARRQPVLAALMTAFMLSLTGIPPMAGFLGKFFLFRAAVDGRFYLLAIVGVLNSVIGACYYLRVVVHMYMKEASTAEPGPTLTVSEALSLAACLFFTLYLGLLPRGFLEMARSLL